MDNLDNNRQASACDVTPAEIAVAANAIQGDTELAISFLKAMHPTGPWVLTAINPETGKTQTATFGPETNDQALFWITARNGTCNLYFSTNPVREPMSKKAKATDIAALAYLHVDIDPCAGEDLDAERSRILRLLTDNLPAGVSKPTAIVFSGGGYQAFWKLETPLELDGSQEAAEKAKLWNLNLETLFGCADSCHNIDRIMRLPGTVNLPNAKKLKKGRVPTPAAVVEADWSRAYALNDFTAAAAMSSARTTTMVDHAGADVDLGGDAVKLTDVHDLDQHTADKLPFDERVKRIIQHGHDNLEDRVDGKPADDRSRWVLDAVCAMVRRGIPDQVILSVLLDRDFRISDHIYDQKQGAAKAAIRQIKRAKEFCSDPTLAELNELHAVLLQEGGKTRVLSWDKSELDGGPEVAVLQTFDDFKNRYMNRFVEVDVAENKPKRIPLGRWWLEHLQRRQYKGLRFQPGQGEEVDGYLNLWRGFAVEPAAGSWELMKLHIRDVLAGGDEAAADYILKWSAWAVQNADKPAEVALVLKGGRGTGKSTFGRWLKGLFGHHGLQVTSQMQLTGRFNKHLRGCCLLFADEAIAPGDKAGESILKGLITEPELMIEGKGIDAIQARNTLHIVMASNERWVVPSGVDERRFAVFEVSAERAQDKAYFAKIDAEMRIGGAAAMLHDLLKLDLADWHPRDDVPQTDALSEQKSQTLKGFEKLFLELLRTGMMPAEVELATALVSTARIPTALMQAYANKQLPRDGITLSEVGRLFRKLGFQKCDRRPRGFVVPSLAEARAQWTRAYFPVQWDDCETWELLQCDLDGTVRDFARIADRPHLISSK